MTCGIDVTSSSLWDAGVAAGVAVGLVARCRGVRAHQVDVERREEGRECGSYLKYDRVTSKHATDCDVTLRKAKSHEPNAPQACFRSIKR